MCEEIVVCLFGGVMFCIFLCGFDCLNIYLVFQFKDGLCVQILNFVQVWCGQLGIVYCGMCVKIEMLVVVLNDIGLFVVVYYGGMEVEVCRVVEIWFQCEDGLIVIVIVVFGMGIDKFDICWVVYVDLLKLIEVYYQEIGWGGWDGVFVEMLMFYGVDDVCLCCGQIDEGLVLFDCKQVDYVCLNVLLGLVELVICCWVVLLGYFGEIVEFCGNCDICDVLFEIFDGIEVV